MLELLATSLNDTTVGLIKTSVGHFLPELILASFACIVLLLDLFLKEKQSNWLAWPSILGVALALFSAVGKFGAAYTSDYHAQTVKSLFLSMIAIDPYAGFFKLICMVGTLVAIVFVYHSREFAGKRMGEFYSLMLCSVVGMCLMASSVDFIMTFIAIELVSIPSYVLVCYKRNDRGGTEASIKYILYGAFSGGVMLFGVSLIYGLTGSTKYHEISNVLVSANSSQLMIFGVAALMTYAGFAYKLASAPFHFWAPDVYQAAPTPVTAWLSVASKAAGIAAILRFLLSFSGSDFMFGSFDWTTALLVIAALTMTIGNVQALLQTNVKRMLAYSSVAHVGYILMGLAGVNAVSSNGYLTLGDGGSAVAFYTLAYMFMNLGAFAVVQGVKNQTGGEEYKDFVGLGEKAMPLAICMGIFLFAFIGLPPTVGFVAKMQLFMGAIRNGGDLGMIVAIIAGLNTAVSAYYYMTLVKKMFLENYGAPEHKEAMNVSVGLYVIAIGMAVMVILLGTFYADDIALVTKNLAVTLGG